MKIPISWLRDFVDITLPIEELAHIMTMAGLEVEEIQFIGLPMPEGRMRNQADNTRRHETKISGLAWHPEKIVVGAVHEVMPHPNADRLVLCRLDDGDREHVVLTGAPNLFPYKGLGSLEKPLMVPYARQGALIYDGHQPGQVPSVLKPAKIRGIESYSMICSEKELGISDEHEGVIILDEDAPLGQPLVEYMGDAVLDITITPNIARDANVLGVAREVAAITNQALRQPNYEFQADGLPIEGQVFIKIEKPALNPRFVLGLIRGIEIRPSPYWIQRRLRLAGMRPINNIVDATNYAMFEIGEPLHAFDYDILVQRAGGDPPTIITRTAHTDERLTTLDDVERQLDEFTVLVCDTAGPLSIAGVMGGAESEVHTGTKNVLLEGAAWNFINIRRTISAQKMTSEAAYRFSRGVHPAMASRGVSRCLELMRKWSGGVVAKGLVDAYPLPPDDPTVEVSPYDVRRWLGIELSATEIAEILSRLEFDVEIEGQIVRAKTPDHRLDIGEGVIGVADLMEEVARVYGYEKIPETRLKDELPALYYEKELELEERIRDLLVGLGLQELATYRLTAAEHEARRLPAESPPDDKPYLQLANPISLDRNVLRHSLLASVLDVIERNARLRERMALFEIGPIYLRSEESDLPQELSRLVIALTGMREPPAWQGMDQEEMDFYDLKGLLEALFDGLNIQNPHYDPAEHPSFHPGRCARVWIGERALGVMGEVHPLVHQRYDLPESPVLAADLDLRLLLESIPEHYALQTVPSYPPVLEDLALIVDEDLPAARVEQAIRHAGGETLIDVRLFDVYRGEQIEPGKKSLAYSLTYQDPQRTLTDEQVLKVRQHIVKDLEKNLGARLRS